MASVVLRSVIVEPIIVFAHRHDELPWFRVWFTVATVTASIVFNLGIFAVLVASHMGLDVIKYRTLFRLRWHLVAIETMRESLVDIFFITFGILLATLFHHSIAIGGLGRIGEVPMLALNMILRVGPRLQIAEHLLEVVTYWQHHFTELSKPGAPLTKGEKTLCAAMFFVVSLTVLLTTLSTLSWGQIYSTTRRELTPRLELNITKTLEELH